MSKIIMSAICFILLTSPSHGALGYIKRGFKHCTGVCDKQDICVLDQDKTYRWCVANCSHKIDVVKLCKDVIPTELRPILPYEVYPGTYNLNQFSEFALKHLDINFIKQTKDRKRAVGTAIALLLFAEQYLNGVNVQKLNEQQRENLGVKLLKNFYKNDPKVIEPYEKTGIIDDGTLAVLYDNITRKVLEKYNKNQKK